MEEEKKIILTVDTGDSNKSIKDLRRELLEAKDAMAQAKEGSREYLEALDKAAAIKDKIGDLNREISLLAGNKFETATGLLSKSLGGLVNAFGGVTAAMQLFGVENEDVVEGIAKLQQITTIANSLQGIPALIKNIGTTTKFFRLLNAAMSANPAMLVVSGVVALTAALAGLFVWISRNNEEQEKSNKLAEENLHLINARREANSWELEVAQAEGKSKKELIKIEREQLEGQRKMIQEEISRLEKKEDLTEREKGILKDLVKQREEAARRISRLEKDAMLEDIRLRREAEEAKKKEEEEAERRRMEEAKRRAEERRRGQEKEQQEAERNKAEELRRIDAINARIEESRKTEVERLREKQEEELSLYRKHGKDVTTLIEHHKQQVAEVEERHREEERRRKEREIEHEAERERRQKEWELQLINNHWQEVAKRNAEAYSNGEITQAEYNARAYHNQVAHLESLLESQALSYEEQIQTEKQLMEAKRALIDAEVKHRQEAYAQISNILNMASDMAGKNTAEGKALAVAAATISTYQAAQQAYLSAFMPVPTATSPVLAALNVAAAVATGLKNVQNIIKTKIPTKAGSSFGGGGGVSAPTITMPRAPQIQQQIQPTRNQQTQVEVDMQRQPIKAYVVESELRAVQQRARQVEDEARI